MPSAVIQPLYELFRLHTTLFANCLDGIDEALAWRRITDNTNNLIFLGAHLVDERYYIEELMGGTYEPPFPQLVPVKSVDELPDDSPPIDTILDRWMWISGELDGRFHRVTEEQLSAPSPFDFYPSDAPQTILHGVAFLLHHEAYHIGQMGLLRKGLGLPAMKYE